MRARLTVATRAGASITVALQDVLTPMLREDARVEANHWIKRLRAVRYGADTMRTRFTYRGESLWWFTEIYLHKMRRLDVAVATVLALDQALAAHDPARLRLESTDDVTRTAARAFAAARRVEVTGADGGPGASSPAWPGHVRQWSAQLSRLRPHGKPRVPSRPQVLAFVHSAFWRTASQASESAGGEHYIGPVLEALERQLDRDQLVCVGVGPHRNFRARRWWDPLVSGAQRPAILPIERLAPHAALADSRALWAERHRLAEEVSAGASIREAAVYRGVDLWPILEAELRATAWLQWPWAARAMDEAAAALDVLDPARVVTYAEAGGWGRALMLEARRRSIPSVGLQHGFIYRHWLNYLHEPDEMASDTRTRGFPRPDRTLVFDRFAADHLQQAGHFPPEAVAVTGNPRLDELAARVGAVPAERRQALRERLGATLDRRLALLTAKHTEIRGELPRLRDALATLPEVRLAVKPHPAETPEVYAELAGAANVTVLPAEADLAELLAAADAIVTMNSTVAVDGVVLGIPALVLGLPNNLSPLVEAGVMIGVEAGSGPAEALQSVLYNRDLRDRLDHAGRAFIAAGGLGADQQAARRSADAILGLRRGRG